MGTFNTKAMLQASPTLIPKIADRICQEFQFQGYEVKKEDLISGGADISIAKGNLFKAALGMKTALKITLIPMSNAISFEAGVGIFGHQVIPTIIMWFFSWPVLITQIWGMVQQSKLDDKALEIARQVVAENAGTAHYGAYGAVPPPAPAPGGGMKFCTNCGAQLSPDARFCSSCGTALQN